MVSSVEPILLINTLTLEELYFLLEFFYVKFLRNLVSAY